MASGPSTGPPSHQLTFYPAFCYKASPTYFTWVKLTASDIHHSLRHRPQPDFDHNTRQQQLLFCLNHPVQFVCIVGVIVAFDEYFDKFWLFTIDDSSGSTIDVTCRKPPQEVKARVDGQDPTVAPDVKPNKDKVEGLDDGNNEEDARNAMMAHLDIGRVVRVKGTIKTFRNVRQIQLERITLIPDTSAEMRFWDQRSQLLADVLSKPWTLSEEMQKKLHREAEGEKEVGNGREKRRRGRTAQKLAREKKDKERINRRYEREEREREIAAEKAKKEGMRLRSEVEVKQRDRAMIGKKKVLK